MLNNPSSAVPLSRRLQGSGVYRHTIDIPSTHPRLRNTLHQAFAYFFDFRELDAYFSINTSKMVSSPSIYFISQPPYNLVLHFCLGSNLDIPTVCYLFTASPMMASTPISMPLNILTKQQLKKSEDSLALSHISQCRNEPSPTEGRDDSALSLKQIPSLNNNSISSFTIGASWLTKSNSLHSSSSSVYSSSEPNNKRQYTMTTTNSETSARSSIISQSQESAKSTVSSVGVTSVSEDSQYSQKSAQQQRQHKQKRRGEGLKQALSLSSLQMRDSFERNPFK